MKDLKYNLLEMANVIHPFRCNLPKIFKNSNIWKFSFPFIFDFFLLFLLSLSLALSPSPPLSLSIYLPVLDSGIVDVPPSKFLYLHYTLYSWVKLFTFFNKKQLGSINSEKWSSIKWYKEKNIKMISTFRINTEIF